MVARSEQSVHELGGSYFPFRLVRLGFAGLAELVRIERAVSDELELVRQVTRMPIMTYKQKFVFRYQRGDAGFVRNADEVNDS